MCAFCWAANNFFSVMDCLHFIKEQKYYLLTIAFILQGSSIATTTRLRTTITHISLI